MEEDLMDLDFFGCGSTCANLVHEGHSCKVWSPDIDWEHVAGVDDFHELFGSMVCDEDFGIAADYYFHLDAPPSKEWSTSVSPSSTNCPGTPAEEHPPPSQPDGSLRLVHLLMAGAEALGGPHQSPHLAHVILARLRELLARGGASSMERLAAHFTNALQGLLAGAGAGAEKIPQDHREDIEAMQLLQDMCPYVKFGHFTANQAILEAIAGERRVHIVDYDIMEGVQWASLMQSLVSSENGFPPPHLRITAVARGRRSLKGTGRRLAAFASSVGLPFSFGQCQLDYNENFRPSAVKIIKGEAVVLNCVIHPSSGAGARSFLAGAAELRARVVTLVDQESEETGFVGSFMEEMRRYSAMWDSLEAGFPKEKRARITVEKVVLAPMIAGAVGRAYMKAGDEGRWGDWLKAAKFKKVGLSFFNLSQARLLLSLFNGGYHFEEDGSNKLVLCWKSCRLLSASVWSAPPRM